MQYKWTLLTVLLSTSAVVQAAMRCQGDDKCWCLSGSELEYHCPKDYDNVGGLVMHFSEKIKSVGIDCYPLKKSASVEKSDDAYSTNFGKSNEKTLPKFFNVDLLPNATFGPLVLRMEIRFCPLPKHGFREILDKLGITELKTLQFGNWDESITLHKKYFEGLGMLESLIIEKNHRVVLEEDVFENTPNLTSIELPYNNIQLSSGIFDRTLKLLYLDMTQNKLNRLPEGLFRRLDNLKILHLWDNNLTTIDESLFKGLSNLRSLELSVNNLESISENTFRNLNQLIQISMKKNNLNQIPATLFHGNPKLRKVVLRINPNLSLPDYFFANMSSLQEVDLANCNLESIPQHLFENSKNLTTIDLSSNKLRKLPNDVFKNVENLTKLDLKGNFIEDVSNVFSLLYNLELLNLENNLINVITRFSFEDLSNLVQLNLRRNQITKIEIAAFDNQVNLKKLDLSHNMISGEIQNRYLGGILDNIPEAEEINLSHNRITFVENVVNLDNKLKLIKLNLSYNRIKYLPMIYLRTIKPTGKLVIDLEHNNITTVYFSKDLFRYLINETNSDARSYNEPAYTEIYIGNNPLSCDCHNYQFLKYIRSEMDPVVRNMFEIKADDLVCATPLSLKNQLLAKIPPHFMICSMQEVLRDYRSCPKLCSCNYRPFDNSMVIDCANLNLKEYPQIILPSNQLSDFNQTELHLENNDLTAGPDSSLNYKNITKLYLHNNQIRNLTWLPSQLQVLTLNNNQLNNLDYQVLEALNNTRNLTLSNNPWLCECEADNLTTFLRQHVRQVDVNKIYCANTSTLLLNLNRKDLCHEWQAIYAVIPVMVLLLASAILVALYYRYQKELKIWLFAKNLCLWWVTEEDLDKDKIYDAFISYSHKDEDFVTQNLLPRLESGPNPYKLCLHYRNWIPGEFIAKQVTNSVLESRRTLVVLSPNFLESVWGKMEFRTAHTQAMTEGRARVIIVLYGDVEVNSLDNELKAYLKTNTYVKWGEPYFWNKLMYALPHYKRNISHIDQKHTNVMNYIDDKFKLVAPVTSPGSTPPVLTLDATLLKKHPLTFVPSPEMDTPPAEAGTLLTSTC